MPSNQIGHDKDRGRERSTGGHRSTPHHEADGKFTFEEAREEQAELEALIRKYDGDFQAAVDAQRRGEKPDDEEPPSQNW
jgi:hypothetical protein